MAVNKFQWKGHECELYLNGGSVDLRIGREVLARLPFPKKSPIGYSFRSDDNEVMGLLWAYSDGAVCLELPTEKRKISVQAFRSPVGIIEVSAVPDHEYAPQISPSEISRASELFVLY